MRTRDVLLDDIPYSSSAEEIKSVLRNLSNIEWRINALLCLRPDSLKDD